MWHRPHSGSMSDRLHDHTTIGIRRGCVACAQFEADFALSARAYREANPDLYVRDSSRSHPEVGSRLPETTSASPV